MNLDWHQLRQLTQCQHRTIGHSRSDHIISPVWVTVVQPRSGPPGHGCSLFGTGARKQLLRPSPPGHGCSLFGTGARKQLLRQRFIVAELNGRYIHYFRRQHHLGSRERSRGWELAPTATSGHQVFPVTSSFSDLKLI
ncbi:hypothetical protein RRG08_018967 [Elysia crispata]|uniref:Uncharacterized protein n=1 Tax=Elysia crispata TaxID=231223 RepID=A0AAE1A637_9GAST|nr:hypothetical protein RRG08_018967 [Elysia crispata]